MMLPDYWLQRPNIEIDSQTRSDFDQLFARVKAAGDKYPDRLHLPGPQMAVLVLPGRPAGCCHARHRRPAYQGL